MLAGSGVSWQDGACFDVRPGDCLVHRALTEAHTLRAGADGARRARVRRAAPGERPRLPRAGVVLGARHLGAEPAIRRTIPGSARWRRASPTSASSPSARRVVNARRRRAASRSRHAAVDSVARDLGMRRGSVRTGLSHVTVHPGQAERAAARPLGRGGDLRRPRGRGRARAVADAARRGPAPRPGAPGPRRPRRRAPGRDAHRATASAPGRDGMTLLSPTARASRATSRYYPRSNKVNFRGVGLIARLEDLDYWDGGDSRVKE